MPFSSGTPFCNRCYSSRLACVARCSSQSRREKRAAKPRKRVRSPTLFRGFAARFSLLDWLERRATQAIFAASPLVSSSYAGYRENESLSEASWNAELRRLRADSTMHHWWKTFQFRLDSDHTDFYYSVLNLSNCTTLVGFLCNSCRQQKNLHCNEEFETEKRAKSDAHTSKSF